MKVYPALLPLLAISMATAVFSKKHHHSSIEPCPTHTKNTTDPVVSPTTTPTNNGVQLDVSHLQAMPIVLAALAMV